jgi:hypothetical protein
VPEANYDVGVRLKADGSGLVGETKQGVEALKGLEEQAKKTGSALGEVSRSHTQASESLRALIERARQAGVDVDKLGRDVAKITSTQGAYNTILGKTIESELRWQATQAAATQETGRASGALATLGEELERVAERKLRVSSLITGVIGKFGGPIGLIAMLGTATAAWLGFGTAAEHGARAAEEAAKKAKEAAESLPSPTQLARTRLQAIGAEIGQFQRGLAALPAQGIFPESETEGWRYAWLQNAIRARQEEAARLAWANAPGPGISIEEATKGLRTASTVLEEYQQRLKALDEAFGARMTQVAGLALEPAEKQRQLAQLATEKAEFEAAARRQYEAGLKSLEVREPKVRKEGSDFDRLIREATQLQAANEARLEGTEKLTTAERRLAEIEALYAEGLVKNVTPAQMDATRAAFASAAAVEREVREREKLEKAAKEAAQAYHRSAEHQFKELEQLEKTNQKLREHNQELGLTTAELGRVKAARAEAALAAAQEALALDELRDKDDAHNAALRERVRLLEDNARYTHEGAQRAVVAEQEKKALQEAKRITDNLEHSLTDATVSGLRAGFERGESVARNFLNRLKEMFYTAVLTPIIQPIVRPVAQFVGGAVSSVIGGITGSLFPGVANAGGGLNLASNALSAANFFGGGGVGFLGGLGTGLTMPAAELAALIESGTVGVAGAGLEAAALGGFGAVAPWLGVGALALGALGLFGDDDEGKPPDASSYVTLRRAGGRLELGPHAIYPGTTEDRRYLDELVVRLNALHPAARSVFDPILGRSLSTGGYSTAEEIGRQFIEPVIAQAKQFELELGVLRSGVPMAQVGLVQLGQSVETLGRELGTGVKTLEDWRGAFLAAADAGADAEKIAQWRALGTAIGQAAQASAQLAGQQTQIEAQLRGTVRGLPQQLGISSLEAARMSLATAESQAPLERFAAARAFLGEGYARALGGDLAAVQAFPELLQSALGIGREVFASGPQFAELFREGNRMLNDLLAHQREIEADIVASVPATIRDAAADQIAEIRSQTKQLVEGLAQVKSEIQRLQTALAA